MNRTETKYFYAFITFSVVLISVYSVEPYTKQISISNTFIWWVINFSVLLAFFIYWQTYYKKGEGTYLNFVTYYIIWNLICIFRGFDTAKTYWEWKGLAGNSMSLLLPLISYCSTNILFVKNIFKTYLKFALPLFAIIFYFITTDSYGFYLAPIGVLMLFFPLFSRKTKIIIGLFTLLVLTVDLGARSNVIKFAMPVLFMTSYYFKQYIPIFLIETLRKLLFIIPFLFFVLAVTGVFNVFNFKQYSNVDFKETRVDATGETIEDDISSDTRTFLYEEVLESAKKHDYWWFGRTPARGNDTKTFTAEAYLTGKEERLSNEVGILNVFTWTGIIGVLFHFFIFYSSSYVSLHYSNNYLYKILSIFSAFRWLN